MLLSALVICLVFLPQTALIVCLGALRESRRPGISLFSVFRVLPNCVRLKMSSGRSVAVFTNNVCSHH